MKRKYTVANVLLGKDTFSVIVQPGADYAFIATLIAILDEINKEGGECTAEQERTGDQAELSNSAFKKPKTEALGNQLQCPHNWKNLVIALEAMLVETEKYWGF